MIKTLAIGAAMALASTLAVAQSTKDQVPNRSEAPHNETMPGSAGDYWNKHAKGGYMTREDAMAYKPRGARTMDYTQLDSDRDGRVSQQEWMAYHQDTELNRPGARDAVSNRSEAPSNPTTPR